MNTLINEDCHVALKSLKDSSVDMVLTDPPYNTTKNKYEALLNWDLIWAELNRVCKPKAPIVLFGQMPFSAMLINSNINGYKHYWVWQKNLAGNFAVAKYQPLSVTEDIHVFNLDDEEFAAEHIYVFSKDGKSINYYPQMVKGKMRKKGGKAKSGQGFGGLDPVYYWSDDYYPTNILNFPVVSRIHSLHPSQKPVELLEYLINTYSQENDTVLDFAAGVFSTGIACKNLNRNFIGIEVDSSYFNIAKERLNEYDIFT
jgi:site-specific DNA-methyltransferase (adenine-specific)